VISDLLCLSSFPALHFFPIILFWVHHLVNRDDWQLLAHAMASDFSVPGLKEDEYLKLNTIEIKI
jgi:hypothetical protein